MKKLTTTFLLLAAMNFYSRAQWVSIPDTNFGTWLNTNGYSSCLQGNNQVGWQMDTTCSAVVTENAINVNNNNIKDLTGIQYFDNLINLDCDNNELSTLPPLPSGLAWLVCRYNNLTSLPPLPSGIRLLDVDDNELTSLPFLPSLENLSCNHNQLTGLPMFPPGFYGLNCSYNQLTSLPPLPSAYMSALYIDANQISSLPDLPDSIHFCDVSGNPLNCLPRLGYIGSFRFDSTNITCVPNYGNVGTSNPSLQSLPLCQPGTPCALPNYVVIPDTNFGTWLNTNGYSACMVGNNTGGWLMDTTCAAVINADTIWCSFSSISDLTGIQYFDNLKELYCTDNQLTSLSALPNTLINLVCAYNQIASIPSLPDSLRSFTCESNNLSSLPPLPNFLESMNCAINPLISLPSLPNGIKWLMCMGCQLTSLPNLPVSLTSLACHVNMLNTLPALPGNIRDLTCSNNQLTSLPALPNSLAYLYCNGNQLSILPELPDSLDYCWINDNPITCLPELKRIVNLDFSNTLITCKPDLNLGNVTNSTPSLASLPLCQPGSPCALPNYVAIPDTNFGTWLNTHGYSSCLIGNNTAGWQMDTTCPAVTGAIELDCGFTSINDLTGIQYFDSLQTLGCGQALLTSLPDLPVGLISLTCEHNQLSALPSLPVNLAVLNCAYNQLTSLPILPTGLTILACSYNQLSVLPPLPATLTELSCRDNLLTGLPALPNGLTSIWCGHNQLSSLPALPNSLTFLYCGNNPLGSLPVLPGSLDHLDCEYSLQASLPPLPASLTYLNCLGNQITSLPALPDSLFTLYIQNNDITCLPKINFIEYFYFYGNLITCLPNYGNVINSNPPQQTLPLCQPGNANGCEVDSNCISFQINSSIATNVSCNGGSDGSITVNTSGGTLPYSYSYSPPNLIDTVMTTGSGGGMGTFTISVISAAGIRTGMTVYGTGIGAGAVVVSIAGTTIITLNVANTSAVSGTLMFIGTVSAPQAGNTFNGLSAGTYTVFVRDSNLCSATDTVVVTEPPLLSVAITTTNVSCNGGNDGILCANVTGGTSSYVYAWSNFSTAQCANNLSAGVYTVTVVDFAGCTVTATGNISEPSPISLNIVITGDGIYPDTLTVNVVGGCIPYLYNWSNGSNIVLSNGTYYLTITDACGCSIFDSITVGTSPSITVTYPNGGETFTTGQNVNVTWTSSGNLPKVKIEFYSSILFNWTTLEDSASNTGSYSFTIPQVPNMQARIRISDPYDSLVNDQSDGLFNILQGVNPAADAGADQTICTGDSVVIGGSPTASGGSGAPYTYSWGPAAGLSCISCTNPTVSGITVTTTYCVTVTDNGGGTASDCAVVTVNASPTAAPTATPDTICLGASSTLAANAIAGSGSISTYTWGGGLLGNVSGGVVTPTTTTIYSVTVTNSHSCTATGSVEVTVVSASLQVTSATNGALPDTLCVIATGSAPPYMYNWSGNVNGLPNLCFELLSGAFSVTISDANGCSASFSTNSLCPTECVWPGDADYNGIADNSDLLPIGLAYGKNGPPRAQQDINWSAHVAQDWIDTITTTGSGTTGNNIITVASSAGISLGMAVSGTGIAAGAVVTSIAGTTLALSRVNTATVSGTITFTTPSISTGVNSKHIDCDGNGTVNADDTLAILQNFGLTHAKTDEQRDWRMTDPAFYVDLAPDTTHAGDTLYANLTLGDINVPANDVYGLAFTLNYDATVVDSSKTKITFGNSWVGTATDKISIAKNFHPTGQLKCAITRIDHATRSGFGQIGQAEFVITTDNINGKTYAYYPMNVWITDLVMIDNLGNYITANEGIDSSLVEFEPTSITDIGLRNADLKIQPNPASDEVQIVVTDELIGGELKLLDVEGRVLLQTVFTTRHLLLTTRHFAQGIYFIQVRTEHGMLTKRLVIAR